MCLNSFNSNEGPTEKIEKNEIVRVVRELTANLAKIHPNWAGLAATILQANHKSSVHTPL